MDSLLIHGTDESFVNELLKSPNLDQFISDFYDRNISIPGCSPEQANRESRFKFERATAECHGLIKVLIKTIKIIFEVIRGSAEKLKSESYWFGLLNF